MGSARKEGHFGTDEGALRIHQAIARDLGTAILTGKHKPGDLFEGEIEAERKRIAETHGVEVRFDGANLMDPKETARRRGKTVEELGL